MARVDAASQYLQRSAQRCTGAASATAANRKRARTLKQNSASPPSVSSGAGTADGYAVGRNMLLRDVVGRRLRPHLLVVLDVLSGGGMVGKRVAEALREGEGARGSQ